MDSLIAVTGIEWTAASFIIALVVIGAIILLTRDQKNHKLRVGFFLERERFPTDEKEEP